MIGKNRRGQRASGARVGALGAGVFAAALCMTVGTGAAGYASETTATVTPAPTTVDASVPPTDTAPPTSSSSPVASSTTANSQPPAATTTSPMPRAAPSGGVRHHATPLRSAERLDATAVDPSSYLVLTATGLDVVGLSYVGTFTATTTSGEVQVLRFTMTSAALAGLRFVPACSTGATTVTDADSASLGDTTFDAVQLDMTVGSTPLTFTVADPPATGFPAEAVLRDVTLTATSMSAGTLTATGATTRAATC